MMDREQARIAAGFRSVSRANVRLAKLVRAGLLTRRFIGTIQGGRKAIYMLTDAGAEMIGAAPPEPIRSGTRPTKALYVEHTLKINDIQLNLTSRELAAGTACQRSLRFTDILSPRIRLIPDAYFELVHSGRISPMFLEVDLGTEPLSALQKKIEWYIDLALSGEFKRLFLQDRFRVLVTTSSERRLESIRALAARRTDRVFWFSTFDIINRDGVFAPVWRKPIGTQMLPLL